MRKYYYEQYTLTLLDTEKWEGNKHRIAYKLEDQDGIIFSGNDFFSPDRDVCGVSNASSILGFLTMVDGDTGEEYFSDYNPRQIYFRDNGEADELKSWQFDLEGIATQKHLSDGIKRYQEEQ